MCDLDFLCGYWPIISISGLILGVWIGAVIVFFFLKKYINGHIEKDQKIADLLYSTNKLIGLNKELEEEIELRDNELRKGNSI